MELEILKPRHSLAHLLAQAVQQTVDAHVALGTGPAVDDWFYYDVLLSEGITFGEGEMKELTKVMQGLVKQNQSFVLYTAKNKAEAEKIVSHFGDAARFKKELISKFDEKGISEYTFYLNTIPAAAVEKVLGYAKDDYKAIYKKISEYFQSVGAIDADKFVTFLDLCEGPHVETTKEIDPGSFVLDTIAGAYRQAKETNPQMTRIYGLAFESKDALKKYQEMMEEAKKRDHKKIGKQQNLFVFSELVGPGLPMFTINGTIIMKELEDFILEQKKALGYTFVHIPHIAKRALYEKSWHMGKYDAMMPVMTDQEGDEYVLKAMNCPHHFELYKTQQFSYRDMPIRFAENTMVYRNEKSWELQGLTRVKALTQDDTHHFVRHDQIESELKMILALMEKVYNTFGFNSFKVEISIRDLQNKQNYFGSDEIWSKAESVLIETVKKRWVEYSVEEGEAAFYGPKIDIRFKDAIGRSRQLTTVQLDFNQPENFDLYYIDAKGEKQRPAVLHVAILGSLERFMGVMIEHFIGVFPLWLAPTQIMFIPVAEKFTDHCNALKAECAKHDLRAKVDESDDSFSKKIRNAELDKIPYIVIIGEKEVSEELVSFRVYKTKEQGTMSASDFISARVEEYKNRSL